MKIQVGKLFINKTIKYLIPCLNVYGKEFALKIDSLFKVGVGIGDMILKEKNIIYEKHIFVLVDVKNTVNFKQLLSFIKEHPSYEDDYAFDNVANGCLHMIIVKLPQECVESFNQFVDGKYSKMYSLEQIQEYFSKANKKDVKCVLIKDNNYRIQFAHTINKEFETTIEPHEVDELEFPLNKFEEFFQVNTFTG